MGAVLIFTHPPWVSLLWTVAAAALIWELGATVRFAWLTAGGVIRAIALAPAVLVAGPLVALGAIIYAGMTGEPGGPFRGKAVITASLRGSLVAILSALLLFGTGASNRWPAASLVVIAVCATLWAVRAYGQTTAPISRRVKVILLVLRIIVIVLLACWAADPALEYHDTQMVRGAILIGVDSSASMNLRDMPPDYRKGSITEGQEPVTRTEAVRHAILDQRVALEALTKQADVHVFEFAANAGQSRAFRPDREADKFATAMKISEPRGQGTALGDSISGASDVFVNSKTHVAAILLITDGCNNISETITPDKLAAVMGSRGAAIFTVGAGSDKVTPSTRTLNIRDLACADEVEAFNRLPIEANLEAIGLEGSQLEITCRFGKKEVASSIITVASPHLRLPLKFEHVPLNSGFHRLVVSARQLGSGKGDMAGQRTSDRLVHVVDRELRVLYVEGKFRYEKKFITAAIDAGRRFRIIPMGPKGLEQLGEKLDDWLGFHAIIFGDIAASHFSQRQLEIVKELVSNYGKGFCMIGGADSFGHGGWAETPIADVIGVDLQSSLGQITNDITVHPTPQGLKNEMMWISPDSTASGVAAAWGELPSMPGANVLAGLKPLATALAVSQRGDPLIVVQSYGKGRSLAIAFDMTWRWVLTPKDTTQMQKRFWRQVALFLAAPKGNVWIATDKARYSHKNITSDAQVINITAGVEDAQGRPLLDTPVKVTLTTPQGVNEPVPLRPGKDMRTGHISGLSEPGEYVLKIAAEVAGRPMSAEHRFEVIKHDMESLDVLANFQLLQRMAAASDGKFRPLSEFDKLLKELKVSSEPKARMVPRHNNLADFFRWPIVVTLIALLCVEWSFRKRKGLV